MKSAVLLNNSAVARVATIDPTFPQERIFAAIHSDPMLGCYRKGFFAGQRTKRVRLLRHLPAEPAASEFPGLHGLPPNEPRLIMDPNAEEG